MMPTPSQAVETLENIAEEVMEEVVESVVPPASRKLVRKALSAVVLVFRAFRCRSKCCVESSCNTELNSPPVDPQPRYKITLV